MVMMHDDGRPQRKDLRLIFNLQEVIDFKLAVALIDIIFAEERKRKGLYTLLYH